jgi:hypothetical protein
VRLRGDEGTFFRIREDKRETELPAQAEYVLARSQNQHARRVRYLDQTQILDDFA